MKQFNEEIREIITKENERYLLSAFRLIESKDKIISALCADVRLAEENRGKEYSDFRKAVLHKLYTEYVSPQVFHDFVHDRDSFAEWLFRIYKNVLKQLQRRYKNKQTIDSEIGTSPYTAAFKASRMYLSSIFGSEKKEYTNPEFTENDLYIACSNHYPVDMPVLTGQLKKQDTDFWEIVSFVIHKIAGIVIRYYLYDTRHKDDLQSDVSIRSVDKVRELVATDKIPVFENGVHFKNYLANINFNNLRNFQKRVKSEQDSKVRLEDISDLKIPEEEYEKPGGFYLSEIDVNNKDEVHQGLVDVLYNKREGIYQELIKDVEEGLDIIIKYRQHDVSYDEIIEIIYGDGLPGDERKRIYDNMRQTVSRTRRTLVSRFYKLISKPS